MKEIIFVGGKIQHTLTAFLNMDSDLIFDDVEYHPAGGGEVNDYLMVRARHKSHLLNLLGRAFDGISDTCGEVEDERLFCALERMARSGHWKSLDEIENWLMERDVPFTKRIWVEKK